MTGVTSDVVEDRWVEEVLREFEALERYLCIIIITSRAALKCSAWVKLLLLL